MTPNDVEQKRADPTGLASRPDMRLSLWLRAHARQVGAVMMAVGALGVLVCLWWVMSGGW